jgi:nitrogen regulatory protein PII-like uncharacterized protein
MENNAKEMQAVTAVQVVQKDPAPMDLSSAAMIFDNQRMELVMRYAEVMASGKVTTPKHLQGSVGDCAAIIMQAMRWGMDPAPVAQKTHVINGVLGYEAQLVSAVVKKSGEISGRFHYEYKGKSPNLECRVGAVIKGETEITWIEWLNENTVTTKNSPLWKSNPPHQIAYLQTKNWARLHASGAILGVYTPDELETFKPPINMGDANVVVQAASNELIEQANKAASGGQATYQKFWQETGKDNRKSLEVEHIRLKEEAAAVDRTRTVDDPTNAQQETGEVTFESVLKKIEDASSEDQLNVAADWINAITDNASAKKLNARFDERLAAMRGAA